MKMVELKLCENTSGDVSSDNPAIRIARSKLAAAFMLFVSLLYPFESFSANCQLRSTPVCINSEGCRDVIDPNGKLMKVCLSTNPFPPPGALISTASCWQYKAAYDCMNQATPSYTDTCQKVKDGGSCVNYAELSTKCNPDIPKLSGGACAVFDVAYQCEVAPGNPYQETVCSSGAACVDKDGKPSFCVGPLSQESNKSLGLMVAATETARQAGTYIQTGDNPAETDLTKIGIFKGEQNRCAEGAWGTAPNCCKPEGKGASINNALITQILVEEGWDAIATAYTGSGYQFDTLLDKTMDLVDKAMEMMQKVMEGVSNSVKTINTVQTGSSTISNASNVANGANTASKGLSMTNIGGMIGGAIGGQVGGATASQYASKNGANTGWTGTIGALGSAAGSVIGTYAGAYAAGVISSVATGGTVMAGITTGGTAAANLICTPCLVIMVIVVMIMSFAACTPEDMKTQMKLGAPGLCHYVGKECSHGDIFGGCMTIQHHYCCFNSRIGRIIQEAAKGGTKTVTTTTYSYPANQVCNPVDCVPTNTNTCQDFCGTNNLAQYACNGTDPFETGNQTTGGTCKSSTPINQITQVDVPGQIGTWGTAPQVNCNPISVSDLEKLDFSKIDLSEFIDDVVTKNVPNGEKEATNVAQTTQSFIDANSLDVTATDGILVTHTNPQLPPPKLPSNDIPPSTSMGACQVSFKVDSMLADGTTTGTFSISNCNPDAKIVWMSQSNCADAPATSMDPLSPDFTTSIVDVAGAAKFTVTLPPTCFVATTPPIQNMWKGLVILDPHGTLGAIDAIWQ